MADSACEVSIGGYDGDPADVYRSHVLKARKPHKCFECGETIPAGADYERINGKWDGAWDTYSFCLPCSEVSREFSEDGRVFGSLWDEMAMAWDDGAHVQACVNRLSTAAAKLRLVNQWLHWKELPASLED